MRSVFTAGMPQITASTARRCTARRFSIVAHRDLRSRFRDSLRGLRVGKFPLAVEYLGSWSIEAHHVVPPLHDRKAVGDSWITASELDFHRPVGVLLRRKVVDGVGVQVVFLKVSFG